MSEGTLIRCLIARPEPIPWAVRRHRGHRGYPSWRSRGAWGAVAGSATSWPEQSTGPAIIRRWPAQPLGGTHWRRSRPGTMLTAWTEGRTALR